MLKKTIYIFLAFILCLNTIACGQVGEAPITNDSLIWQEQYDLGLRYLSEGNYEEAIIAFTAAIEIDPKRAEAYVGRGDAYVAIAAVYGTEVGAELPQEAQEAYEKALKDYLYALNLNGSTAEVYRKAAGVYESQGGLESAIELLKRGVETTGVQSLQDYQDQLAQQLQPKYVLARQDMHYPDMYDFEMGNKILNKEDYSYYTYSIFTYDNQGYQITWDCWDGDRMPPIHWLSVIWNYDEVGQYWTKTTTQYRDQATTEILENREKGTIDYSPSMSFDDIYALYADPFGHSEVEEGYTTQYTYDGNGNITRIDTYAPDGRLSGWCDFTWEELGTSEIKFSSKDLEELSKLIVEHYTELWQPSGEYTCFASEAELIDGAYVFILRYAMSGEEADEIIKSGGFPVANRYVQTVSVNCNTGEVTDELTDESWIATLP